MDGKCQMEQISTFITLSSLFLSTVSYQKNQLIKGEKTVRKGNFIHSVNHFLQSDIPNIPLSL